MVKILEQEAVVHQGWAGELTFHHLELQQHMSWQHSLKFPWSATCTNKHVNNSMCTYCMSSIILIHRLIEYNRLDNHMENPALYIWGTDSVVDSVLWAPPSLTRCDLPVNLTIRWLRAFYTNRFTLNPLNLEIYRQTLISPMCSDKPLILQTRVQSYFMMNSGSWL